MKRNLAIALLMGLAALQSHAANLKKDDLPNFHVVTNTIARGARPSANGMAWLANHGVTTDISLENKDKPLREEQELALRVGIRFISLPLDSHETPTDQEINYILGLLVAASSRPVYIHCHHGEDRTGLIIALYRIRYQRWTPQQAYFEMISDGFDPGTHQEILRYFEKVTGYVPR
jgi:protein tyrosine/serine phosphatase